MKKKSQSTDYETLGKMVAQIYETGYLDTRKSLKMSFLKGLVSGFGGVIGATVLVAVVLGVLQLMNFTPLQPFSDWLKDTLQTNERSSL